MNKKTVQSEKLGKYLREKRIRARLTQSRVAKKLSYTTGQFISNWETGRSSPPLEVLHRLAKLYRISARELFDMLLKQYREGLARALKL